MNVDILTSKVTSIQPVYSNDSTKGHFLVKIDCETNPAWSGEYRLQFAFVLQFITERDANLKEYISKRHSGLSSAVRDLLSLEYPIEEAICDYFEFVKKEIENGSAQSLLDTIIQYKILKNRGLSDSFDPGTVDFT